MINSVHVEVHHQLAEHVRAERLFRAHSKWALANKIVAAVLLVLGIGLVTTAGIHWWSVIWFVLAPLEFFDVLSPAPLVARLRFNRSPKFRERNELTFSEQGIHFKTSSVDSRLDWSHYDGVLEDEQLFLLIYGQQMYSVIPKRCFGEPGDREVFKQLIEAKITNRTRQAKITAAR